LSRGSIAVSDDARLRGVRQRSSVSVCSWYRERESFTGEESVESLAAAIELILEDRREDALRGVPEDAIRDIVTIG
jgi:hypothetical protein